MKKKNNPVEAIDNVMADLDHDILETARTDGDDEPLLIAAAVLTLPSGDRRVAYWTPEYGDNEGIRNIEEFVEMVNSRSLLKPGETIESITCGWSANQAMNNRLQ